MGSRRHVDLCARQTHFVRMESIDIDRHLKLFLAGDRIVEPLNGSVLISQSFRKRSSADVARNIGRADRDGQLNARRRKSSTARVVVVVKQWGVGVTICCHVDSLGRKDFRRSEKSKKHVRTAQHRRRSSPPCRSFILFDDEKFGLQTATIRNTGRRRRRREKMRN